MPTADQQLFDFSQSVTFVERTTVPPSTIYMPKEMYKDEPVIDQASKIELNKPCHDQQ